MMPVAPYVLTVSDGSVIRSLYPSRLHPADRAALDAIVSSVCAGTYGSPGPAEGIASADPLPAPLAAPATARPAAPPIDTNTTTQGEIARASGFTGDTCGDCGSFSMVRTGTCSTCQACGKTSGGCS